MDSQIKGFQKQFIECGDEGLREAGELQKFKDYPELLPAPWHPAAKLFAKELEKNPEWGLTPLLCLRFGGECYSGHPDCMKLRGWSDEQIKTRSDGKFPTYKDKK